ncbi:MBL fold metallo-hydrolase [Cupriavidus sp. 2TAF22]|uniref:MBL fold metallo-hydrolase n=1 Tax=unclassified Cupriavidus TaxID=2640874 RepID=UPI003F924AF3
MITNALSGTNVHEVSDGIYRINTPVIIEGGPGGFSFNQYLVLDDEPLLFHTGPRKLFELVREAVASVMPPERLRHVSFSHFEADECGSLNQWLAIAPQAHPLCGTVAAMVSIDDLADRKAAALEDGQARCIGKHTVRWLATPHLPHGWDCGVLMEEQTGTLLCSDLFTQPGARHPALTEGDILGPSEAFRHAMDYYAHAPDTGAMLERLASLAPRTLACMHGSAWRGDCAGLLRELAVSLRA